LSSKKNFLSEKKFSDEVKIFSDFENFLKEVSFDEEIDKIFVI